MDNASSPQDRSEARNVPTHRPDPENRLYPLAQGLLGGVPQAETFNETEFWGLVRKLTAWQTACHLSDAAFCRLHPNCGSSSSWRLLKLLAKERKLDLSRWYRRLKYEVESTEASPNWKAPEANTESETEQRVECQDLIAKLTAWCKQQTVSQTRFLREFRNYTGDAATWARMRKGRWDLVNLPKRLALLRELWRLISAH